MALADLLKVGPPAAHRRIACTTGRTLAELPPDEAAALRLMLDPDSEWSGATIARALRDEHGIRISPQNVNRHRRGDCLCPTTTEEDQA